LNTEKELKKVYRGAAEEEGHSRGALAREFSPQTILYTCTSGATRLCASFICPAIVREYDEHVVGIDLFDMLMSLYKVDHKSNRWYGRISSSMVLIFESS